MKRGIKGKYNILVVLREGFMLLSISIKFLMLKNGRREKMLGLCLKGLGYLK